MNRRSRNKDAINNKTKEQSFTNGNTKATSSKDLKLAETSTTYTVPYVEDSEAQKQLDFLRNACPKTQRVQIESAMKSMFHLRRSDPSKILESFPRFLDTPYLVCTDT